MAAKDCASEDSSIGTTLKSNSFWLVPDSRGRPWRVCIPMLLTVALGTCQYFRAASVSHDSVRFIRYAKELTGELPPPTTGHLRHARGEFAMPLLDRLSQRWPTVAVMAFEDQHPAYPLLLLAVNSTVGSLLAPELPVQWSRAGQLASLLGGCCLTMAVYFLGRHLLGDAAALATSIILATAPTFINVGSDALSDAPALAFLVLSTWFAGRLLEGGKGLDALLCGLCGGIGYLFRPEELQAAALAGLMLGHRMLLGRGGSRYRAVMHGLILMLPVAVLCLPYVFIKGSFLTKKARIFTTPRRLAVQPSSAANPGVSPVEPTARSDVVSSVARNETPGSNTSNPSPGADKRTLTAGFIKFGFLWSRDVGHVFFFPLLLGLLVRRHELSRRPAQQLVWSMAVLNLIALPTVLFCKSGYLDQRHVMPMAIITAYWCWPGLMALVDWLRRVAPSRPWRVERERTHDSPRRVPASRDPGSPLPVRQIAMVIVLVCATGFSLIAVMRRLNAPRSGFRTAGEWLRGRVPPDRSVVDPALLAGFYAGLDDRNDWYRLPALSPHQLETLLSRFPRVAFVVLSDRYLEEYGFSNSKPLPVGRYQLTEVESFPLSDDTADSSRVRIYRIEEQMTVVQPALTESNSPAPDAAGIAEIIRRTVK